jgi:hypothetical protein
VGLEKDRYYKERSDRDNARTLYQQATTYAQVAMMEAGRRKIAYHQQEMDRAAYTVVIHLLYDTITFDEDSLTLWVGNLETVTGGAGQALQAHQNGDPTATTAVLERMRQRTGFDSKQQEDFQNLPLLLSALPKNAREELTPLQLATLEPLTNDPHSYVGNLAKNILRKRGYYFAPVYNLPKTKTFREPTVGLTDNSTGTLQVYPNPSNGQFTLRWAPEQAFIEQATLEIRTLSGQLITRRSVTPHEFTEVNLPDVKAGIYYYQLRVADQAPLVGKLIIQ